MASQTMLHLAVESTVGVSVIIVSMNRAEIETASNLTDFWAKPVM